MAQLKELLIDGVVYRHEDEVQFSGHPGIEGKVYSIWAETPFTKAYLAVRLHGECLPRNEETYQKGVDEWADALDWWSKTEGFVYIYEGHTLGVHKKG